LAACQPFQSDDGFFDLHSFVAELRKHLQNIHGGSISQSIGDILHGALFVIACSAFLPYCPQPIEPAFM
jgi:hypothetical protein